MRGIIQWNTLLIAAFAVVSACNSFHHSYLHRSCKSSISNSNCDGASATGNKGNEQSIDQTVLTTAAAATTTAALLHCSRRRSGRLRGTSIALYPNRLNSAFGRCRGVHSSSTSRILAQAATIPTNSTVNANSNNNGSVNNSNSNGSEDSSSYSISTSTSSDSGSSSSSSSSSSALYSNAHRIVTAAGRGGYDPALVAAATAAAPIAQVAPLWSNAVVSPMQAVVDAVLEARDQALHRVEDAETTAAQLMIEREVARSEGKASMVRINILTVLFYSTLGAVMPYLPLYYRYIGVPDAQIGLLGAITPAVTFLVSPLWGALADASGRHNAILLLTFLGSVITRCSLALGSGDDSRWLGVMVALTALLYAPVKPLLDSAILSRMKDKTQYGKSRLFGQVGFGLSSFLMSPLLGAQMRMIFVAQALIAVPTALMMTTFNARQTDEPTTSNSSTSIGTFGTAGTTTTGVATASTRTGVSVADKTTTITNNNNNNNNNSNNIIGNKEPLHFKSALLMVFKDPRVLVFFFVVFTLGVSSGIIENYAYVRIAEVAAKSNVLGYCRFVSSLAGGPMFWLSGKVIKKIGTNAVLSLSLLSYLLRFLIYGFMTAGWHALPAEALRGLTFALFWSASTCYVYDIAPAGLSATMLGMLNGIYGGLGQSLGAMISGQLVHKFGIKKSFLGCAAGDAVLLAVFAIFQLLQRLLSLRKSPLIVPVPIAAAASDAKTTL